MSLDDLRRRLEDFARARDWEQFHTPRNLVLALVGEVGELAELVQWRSDGDLLREAHTEAIGSLRDELADILIYLVRLADVLDVDLEAAARDKVDHNERGYPVDRSRGSARKYNDLREPTDS
jgi:dCTP diphosphatase